MSLVDEIVRANPEDRARLFSSLDQRERQAVLRALDDEISNPWAKYREDPVGFVTGALGEHVWSKQVEILESLLTNRRTAVPACHAPGKSHIAARAIAWWVAVHDPAKTRVVTTANTYRQVKGILWPHIRRVVNLHGLPGEVFTTEWKIDNVVVADGFSPSDHNETAVQGIHAENLLVVVDEAGGISNTIGQALEALMTGGNTRLLLLGNPPTDNMGSWFERACNSDLFNVIPISAYDTPNFTGEPVGPWARNLVDQTWVDDVIRSFGEESAFVQARVWARFPRTTENAVIPISWVDQARTWQAPEGGIRLGVDVAADGGDEFVIAKADGMHVKVVHGSRGNKNPVEVAGTVLRHILEAEKIHEERRIPDRVRVKIDSIGVGWGICGLLEEWGKEGRHHSDVIAVNVAQSPHDKEKFANQRAEMWWAMRELLQPDEHGEQTVSLGIDHKEVAQLTAPSYKSNSSGRIQIESKADMSARGIGSPDRAEALLLAVFEPPRHVIPDVAPLSLPGTNSWI